MAYTHVPQARRVRRAEPARRLVPVDLSKKPGFYSVVPDASKAYPQDAKVTPSDTACFASVCFGSDAPTRSGKCRKLRVESKVSKRRLATPWRETRQETTDLETACRRRSCMFRWS